MAHSEWDLDRFFKILGLGFIFSKRGIGIHFFLSWDWDWDWDSFADPWLEHNNSLKKVLI